MGSNNESSQHQNNRTRTGNLVKLRKPTEQEFKQFLARLWALPKQVVGIETDIPDVRKFIEVKSVDPDYRQAVTSVIKPNSTISYDTNAVLVVDSPINGASKPLVPAVLRTSVVRVCLYLLFVELQRERCMFDTMGNNFH